MSANEDRAWARIRGGLVKGLVIGAIAGILLGVLLGSIVFTGAGTIMGAALAGAIGLGGLGAFWGVLGGLESPDPGREPATPIARSSTRRNGRGKSTGDRCRRRIKRLEDRKADQAERSGAPTVSASWIRSQ